MKWSANGGEEL